MKLTIVSGCACSVKGGELFERIIDDDYCLTERECVHFMRQICDGKHRTASQRKSTHAGVLALRQASKHMHVVFLLQASSTCTSRTSCTWT